MAKKVKKHPGGKPRYFKTPELMQSAIDKYFAENEIVTVCGLALYLGFAQRKSLLDYEGYSGEYCNIIKKAILRIENEYEKRLVTDGKPTGPIFALKNMGWSDRIDATTDGKAIDSPSPIIQVILSKPDDQ